MPRHPIQGISGGKPRIPGAKSAENASKGDDKAAKRARISALSEEYLSVRTRGQRAKTFMMETEAAQKRGELISKRLACLQTGYLLTCFRQNVLAEPTVLARQLVAGGFLEEKHEHEVRELVKSSLSAMLEELADLPFRISDPDWAEKIDADLRVEDDGESGGRVTDPSEIRRKAEQAKRRRRQKTATMCRLRAEGRVKS
jgi:hypothetical protein